MPERKHYLGSDTMDESDLINVCPDCLRILNQFGSELSSYVLLPGTNCYLCGTWGQNYPVNMAYAQRSIKGMMNTLASNHIQFSI